MYQVVNLQKSRHLSPEMTLPQLFIGQYTLSVEAFVNFAICPIVHAMKFFFHETTTNYGRNIC